MGCCMDEGRREVCVVVAGLMVVAVAREEEGREGGWKGLSVGRWDSGRFWRYGRCCVGSGLVLRLQRAESE